MEIFTEWLCRGLAVVLGFVTLALLPIFLILFIGLVITALYFFGIMRLRGYRWSREHKCWYTGDSL